MWEVLLLEDDAALGRGVRLALQSEKLHVTRCGTLVQAREAWGRGAFDLLILDVNLPVPAGVVTGVGVTVAGFVVVAVTGATSQ